jgi:hypothetical protein
MNTILEIRTSVFPTKGVTLSFEPGLEVSLDCAVCGRTRRTVVFDAPGEPGRCTPTDHVFPGQIGPPLLTSRIGSFGRVAECTYTLTYEYSPVSDPKYPERISSSLPRWARVSFQATCPNCRATSNCSIQNNIVRPWTCACRCGYPLYKETAEFPAFRIGDSGG